MPRKRPAPIPRVRRGSGLEMLQQLQEDEDTALLVRGEDRYGHFGKDEPPAGDLAPAALARRAKLAAVMQAPQRRG